MGFLVEGCHSLLAPLRLTVSKEKAQSGDRQADRDCERAFDIADCMERGVARELVADFMEPLPDANSLWKFNVERSDDRQQYRLYCEGGDFLMYAKASRDTRCIQIFLYDPKEDCSLYDPERPAFTLTCNATHSEWRLVQEKCDNCRHSLEQYPCPCRRHQEIMHVQQTSVHVGDGINHCMEVTIPACGYFGQDQEQRFVTKMPAWHEKVACLVLDFKGRKVLASAKNFQLACDEDASERVVCQYGKIANNTFGLDFRYPLTVIQAFSLSLTTLLWA